MAHLTCMRGLPASGKTSRARAIASRTKAVIVGRDFIRHMMFNDYTPISQDTEDAVTVAEHAQVRALLKSGTDVIVDNTHLQPQYLKAWAKIASETGSTFSIEDVKTPGLVCIERDRNRERTVGEDVIKRMAKRAKYPDIKAPAPIDLYQPVSPTPGLPTAIIVDIDGTLAQNVSGRSPYDYTRVSEDQLDTRVAAIVATFVAGFKHAVLPFDVILCSGRDSECREATEQWLMDNGVWYNQLLMRPADAVDDNGNKLPDWQVKLALFNEHIRDKYNVLAVLDDRNQVVQMWRDVLGLKCLQVQPGDF